MYKAMTIGLMAAAMLTGCKKESATGGVAGNETFKIEVPALKTDIKQGEVQTVRVTVDRDSGFKHPVQVSVEAPEGIAVDPDQVAVEPDDAGDVQLTITAAADAAIGDHRVLVRGVPNTGAPTEAQFTVTVTAP
ncbi:MAG TPA: hypothetical protein P5572_15240 [Phycisphaerae bacterium]|nr:hypothetical protein [Phycisphaerae bacterium]